MEPAVGSIAVLKAGGNKLPTDQCDIVMAGGITSGVVYPDALRFLSERFRFRSIGGTSAGAIAAAAVAAAEFGRANGNLNAFDTIKKRFDELNGDLLPLFQPQQGAGRLFDFAKKAIAAKAGTGSMPAGIGSLFAQFFRTYWAAVTICLFLVAVAVGTCVSSGKLPSWNTWHPIGWAAAVTLTAIICIVFAVGILAWDISRLKQMNFGLCTGRKGEPGDKDALMEWMHRLIQEAAGLEGNDKLLTFGNLRLTSGFKNQKPGGTGIELRMMTTNVSLGIGYALPSLGDGRYFFAIEDMKAILPKDAFDLFSGNRNPATDSKTGKKVTFDGVPLYSLPVGDDMPVILAVRMSLSFPVLFTAIPLYKAEAVTVPAGAIDGEFYSKGILLDSKSSEADAPSNMAYVIRKVWFSDGGITSNFPVRFFDSLVPTRPTFGMSLEDNEVQPNGTASPPDVFLPMPRGSNRTFEIKLIDGLPGFLMAIVNTARERQDRKQSRLPGWQERIARVYLKKGEGGLNLGMDEELIKGLRERGVRAAKLLAREPMQIGHPPQADEYPFDFAEHQWRRLLMAHGVLAETLEKFAEKWSGQNLESTVSTLQASRGVPGKDYPLGAGQAKAIIDDMAALADLASRFKLNTASGTMKTDHARIEIVPRDPYPE